MKDLPYKIAAVLMLLAVVYIATTSKPTTLGKHTAPQWMVEEAKK